MTAIVDAGSGDYVDLSGLPCGRVELGGGFAGLIVMPEGGQFDLRPRPLTRRQRARAALSRLTPRFAAPSLPELPGLPQMPGAPQVRLRAPGPLRESLARKGLSWQDSVRMRLATATVIGFVLILLPIVGGGASTWFWVGGAGTWDDATTTHWALTSGGGGGAGVPTNGDTVIFDANSGLSGANTVTFTGTKTFASVRWGDSGFPATVTLSLSSGLNCTGLFLHGYGTVVTNNLACSWGQYNSSNNNGRTLTLGSSAIALTSAGTSGNALNAWDTGTGTSMTVTANTAVVTISGASAGFNSTSALNLNGLSIVHTGGCVDGNTPVSFGGSWAGAKNFTITGAANKNGRYSFGASPTLTGQLLVQGNSEANRVHLYGAAVGVAQTITVNGSHGAHQYTDFMDLTVAGTAGALTGTSIGVAGNTTGITGTGAVTRFWVGNGGNYDDTAHWSTTTGGASGASVPLPQDTAVWDANSFSSGGQTVANNGRLWLCGNMDWSAVTNSPTFSFSGTVGPVYGFGNVTLGAGFGTWSNSITLLGRGAQTLTSAGKTFGASLIFDSGAGSYTLQDAAIVGINFTLNSGTLNTNSKAVSCGTFGSSNNTARTLTMGSSTITVNTGSASSCDFGTTTNLTVTANTATVVMAGSGCNFNTGPINWNGLSLNFTGGGGMGIGGGSGGTTFNNLTVTGTATTTCSFTLSQNYTFSGTVTWAGNGGANRLLVSTNSGAFFGGTAAVTTQTIAVHGAHASVDFADITIAGAAGTLTGTSIGDCGGNSNITFTAAVTRFGVVAGNFGSTATWSTTSGGAGGASIPLPQDTAVLDGNSAAGTYTMDMPRACKDLTCTGFTRTLTISAGPRIFGSLTLSSGMTMTNAGGFTFAGRGTHTITSAGKAFPGNGPTFIAPGGTYTLQDDWTVGSPLPNASSFTLTSGSFVLNGHNLACGSLFSTGTLTRALNLGSGTVTLGGTGTVWNIASSGMTLTATSSTIVVSDTSSTTKSFAGSAGLSYGTLRHLGGGTSQLGLQTNYSFVNLDVENCATFFFAASVTTTVTGTLTLIGSSLSSPMLVRSGSSGVQGTISLSTTGVLGQGTCLSIQDLAMTGTNAPITVFGSTSVSNNSGITFGKYAVAAGGNWSATATWSDGVVPSSTTDIALVSGSGSVTCDVDPNCKTLDARGYTATLNLNARSWGVYGSFTLSSGMTFTSTGGNINFNGTGANTFTVTTAGKTMPTSGVYGSTYVFQDAYSQPSSSNFQLSAGTLNTNGQAVSWGSFSSSNTNVRTLTLGASAISITGTGPSTWAPQNSFNPSVVWNVGNSTNMTVNVGTSTVTLTGSGWTKIAGPAHFFNLTRVGTATISDALAFGAGSGPVSVAVDGTLTLQGNSEVNRLIVSGDEPGSAITITAAATSLQDVNLLDIAAAGAAAWSGTRIGNMGGNSGVTFTAAVTRYVVAAGGNMSANATWATTSGGAGGASIPLPQDTLRMDSTSGTLALDSMQVIGNVDGTGSTHGITITSGRETYFCGDVKLPGGTANGWANGNNVNLGGRGSQTISGTATWDCNGFLIVAKGGTYTLGSNLTITTGTNNLRTLNLGQGTFNPNGFNVTAYAFVFDSRFWGRFTTASVAARTVTASTTTWTVSSITGSTTRLVWDVSGDTGVPLTASDFSGATIVIPDNAGTGLQTFQGGGLTYGKLQNVLTGTNAKPLAINGANTFGTLDVESAAARTVSFPAGVTTTITRRLTLKGASGQLLSLASTTPGTAATIVTTSALVDTAFILPSADVSLANRGAWQAFAGAAATQYTVSAWVKGSGTVRIALWDDSAGKQFGSPVTLSSTPQRITFTGTTGAGATSYALIVETNVAQSILFNVDGAQSEAKGFATPYVETTAGAATRARGRVQAPASLVNGTQSWVAARLRMGEDSTAVAGNQHVFTLFDDGSHLIVVYYNGGSWRLRRSATSGANSLAVASAFAKDGFVTVVAAWDAGHLKLSINGAVFSSMNDTNVLTLATALFDIGNGQLWGDLNINADVMWFASGTGTLTDADAATLNGLGNTDPTFSALGSSAAITAVMPFATSAYTNFLGFPHVRSTGTALTSRQRYTLGLHVRGAPGAQITVSALRADGSTVLASTTVTGKGRWSPTTLTFVAAATETVYVDVAGTTAIAGGSFWIDGVQLETGPVATPYATTTRAAARPQLPASLLQLRKGWVAMRVRMAGDSVSLTNLGWSPRLWCWRNDANNELVLQYAPGSRQFQAQAGVGGVFTTLASADVGAFSAGAEFTVVMKWDAANLYLSVNGGAFVSHAAAIPALTASMFDVASEAGANQLQGDAMWFAAGIGDLVDADAATFYGFGDADPPFAAVPGEPSAVWAMNDAGYVITVTGKVAVDAYSDGPASPFPSDYTPLDEDLSLFGTVFLEWSPPDTVDDFYRARLPYPEAQAQFKALGPKASSATFTVVGWHGTNTDFERGSFAIARAGGPFEDLVGRRIRITTRGTATKRQVYAFVHSMADVQEDLTVTRRLFQELAVLSDETAHVVVETVDDA